VDRVLQVVHSRLQRAIKRRVQTIEAGKDLDWATAEALAFGSLMLEGNDIRISGQDVGRGTFSQRYADRSPVFVVPPDKFDPGTLCWLTRRPRVSLFL
jgi:2-oxoglutarate dehydrogenase complex dehydrogenase (E1) component-like enzyme